MHNETGSRRLPACRGRAEPRAEGDVPPQGHARTSPRRSTGWSPGRRPRQAGRPRGAPLPLPPLRRPRLRLRAQHRARRLRGRGRHAARLREAHDGARQVRAARRRRSRAWIIRVARNVAIDHLRQRRAIPCEEVRELRDAARRRRHRPSARSCLRDALATLPEEQRQVVVLRHLVGPHARRDRRRARPHRAARSTACTTAAAARCGRVLAEMECAPTVAGRLAA